MLYGGDDDEVVLFVFVVGVALLAEPDGDTKLSFAALSFARTARGVDVDVDDLTLVSTSELAFRFAVLLVGVAGAAAVVATAAAAAAFLEAAFVLLLLSLCAFAFLRFCAALDVTSLPEKSRLNVLRVSFITSR